MVLLCFVPKKVHLFHSCDPPIKNFPVFALDPSRPYLDWALRGFLTSKSIYDPFKFDLKWRSKSKIWLKCQFAIEPSTSKKIWNVPLDALMCPLQIINDIEPVLSTLHGVNACFIHYPSNVKNYSISHKSETDRPKQKKKIIALENIFLQLYTMCVHACMYMCMCVGTPPMPPDVPHPWPIIIYHLVCYNVI